MDVDKKKTLKRVCMITSCFLSFALSRLSRSERRNLVVVSNPAWSVAFLRLFYKMQVRLRLPFVLVLKRDASMRLYFCEALGIDINRVTLWSI